MSFLRSPITAGPVRPSLAFFHINYTDFVFCFYLYLYVLLLSLVTTVLPSLLELTGGFLINHQCFDLWTTKIYKTYKQ